MDGLASAHRLLDSGGTSPTRRSGSDSLLHQHLDLVHLAVPGTGPQYCLPKDTPSLYTSVFREVLAVPVAGKDEPLLQDTVQDSRRTLGGVLGLLGSDQLASPRV